MVDPPRVKPTEHNRSQSPVETPRLAIVVSHPTQYYSPWFRWLAARGGLTLRVFYLWDAGVTNRLDEKFGRTFTWDVDLLSGYEHEFVPNQARRPGTEHFSGLHNPSLHRRLKAWNPSAILLFGYAYRTHLQLILNPPAPLIFRGDSHLIDQPHPRLIKRLILRQVYRRFAAVTYVGNANRDYFSAFGVPDERLHFVPHCVNAEHFTSTPEHRSAADELRRHLGLSGKRVILFAGKLVPEKQPRELLEAFLAIADPDSALVITGDGVEKPAMLALAAQHPDRLVRFLPFANQSEMPVRYLLADLFVLPSRGLYETWGLAVNEAMHMGVPCLVSAHVGCQRDLVTDCETGWVFDPTDPLALPKALVRALAALSGDTGHLRTQIAARIAGYTYPTAGEGLLRTVAATVGPSAPSS